jgi:Flp pilus assembly pilin Flp
METKVYFRETQEFDQSWLWGAVGLGALADLINFARDERSARETVARLAALGAAALVLRVVTLQTEVREDGLYLRFSPFHRSPKRISFSDLADLQETGYSPLRYGGWGIRWSPRGIAYTLSGKSGVRVERSDGKSVFVGSDRPDELVGAVQEATDRTV